MLDHSFLNSWVFVGISAALIVQFVLLLILCLFRKKSKYTLILDENSLLLHQPGTDFSTSHQGYDHALMSCQYYMRHLTRLEFIQSYRQIDKQASTFWFSLRDTERAKNSNGKFLFGSRGKCVLKIMCHPKLSNLMKNNTSDVLESILDILLTIKEESCPFLLPVFDLNYQIDREALLILNEYKSCGSMRDQMLRSKPFHHLTKTINSKKLDYGKPLSLEKICIYTKQILLGLIYLDKLHFPLKKTHLWLHPGNIFIEQGICKLSGYEMELVQMRMKDIGVSNNDRAGLNSVGQIVFEMATGFSVNYALNAQLEPSKKKLLLKRQDALKDIHLEHLKAKCKPEIVQLVQFLCDEDKCASLHVSIHHPYFDQVSKFNPVEPEYDSMIAVKTLLDQTCRDATKRIKTSSHSRAKEEEAGSFERNGMSGTSSRV